MHTPVKKFIMLAVEREICLAPFVIISAARWMIFLQKFQRRLRLSDMFTQYPRENGASKGGFYLKGLLIQGAELVSFKTLQKFSKSH